MQSGKSVHSYVRIVTKRLLMKYLSITDLPDRHQRKQGAKGKSELCGRYGGEYGPWTMLGQGRDGMFAFGDQVRQFLACSVIIIQYLRSHRPKCFGSVP